MEQKELEEEFEKETKELMEMPETQRDEYVKSIISNLVNAFINLKGKPKIEQAKIANKLVEELNSKATKIIPAVIYTIKPEFRDFYVEITTKAKG